MAELLPGGWEHVARVTRASLREVRGRSHDVGAQYQSQGGLAGVQSWPGGQGSRRGVMAEGRQEPSGKKHQDPAGLAAACLFLVRLSFILSPRMKSSPSLQGAGWTRGLEMWRERSGRGDRWTPEGRCKPQQWSGRRNLFREPSFAGTGRLRTGVCTCISRGSGQPLSLSKRMFAE